MPACDDPLVNDECTVLLVHSNNDHGTFVFTDSGDGPNCPHILTRAGTTVHSQCIKKFCLSSVRNLPGINYVSTPDHADFTFAADFMIDFWLMTTQLNLGLFIGAGNAGAAGIWEIEVNRVGNKISLYEGGQTRIASATSINDSCFYHIALGRSGSNLLLFVDGQLDAQEGPYNTTLNGTHFRIGCSHANTVPLTMHWDELRVSNTVCRWIGNFTPPTSPYSYVCLPPTAKLSGTVKEKGVNVQRTLRAFIRSTGAFYSVTTSLANGTFELDAPDDTTEMFVIAFDDDAGDQYNALIYDRVTGIAI